MPTVALNGTSIYFEDAGAGPAVVLTHAFSMNAEMWRPQVAALSNRWRVVTWDVRGHGRSDSPVHPYDYSEAHVVADLTGLLGYLGIEKAVIGGLSMGGYMTMSFALMRPDLTQALIICDTGPGYRDPEGRAAWNRSAFKMADSFDRGDLSGSKAGLNEKDQPLLDLHRSTQGLAHAARGMVFQAHSGVLGRLGAIEVPSLVIVGDRDTGFHNSASYISSRIPNARRVEIPDAGHMSNLDNPDAFNQAVSGFLDEVAPPN